MKRYIENLPIYDGKITKEIIEIALQNFMDGTKMYFDEYRIPMHEIRTQAGFKNAILKIYGDEIKETTIDKIIKDYNKHFNVEDYRYLKMTIYELEERLTNAYNKQALYEKYTPIIKQQLNDFIYRMDEKIKELKSDLEKL